MHLAGVATEGVAIMGLASAIGSEGSQYDFYGVKSEKRTNMKTHFLV